MADENQSAIQALIDGIEYVTDTKIKNAPFDKTLIGQIQSVNEDGTYNIIINGQQYQNIVSYGGKCSPKQTVKVVVPQNQYSQLFILGNITVALSNKADKTSVIFSEFEPDSITQTTDDVWYELK